MNPALEKLLRADPIAAALCLIVLVLSTLQVPSTLEMSPQLVLYAGGLIVALAGVVRLLMKKGGDADWVGIVLGLGSFVLGFEGSAVEQLDPDMVATIGSAAGGMLATVRSLSLDR